MAHARATRSPPWLLDHLLSVGVGAKLLDAALAVANPATECLVCVSTQLPIESLCESERRRAQYATFSPFCIPVIKCLCRWSAHPANGGVMVSIRSIFAGRDL
jgi:hypothetical protein